MGKSRQEWIDEVESRIPRKNNIVERNRAVTAQYASWYLQKPELFKWAGMAAFASRQVGLALAVAELMHGPGMFIAADTPEEVATPEDAGKFFRKGALALLSVPSIMHSFAAGQLLLSDLDEIRRGNNSIYYDIAWAHAAYLEDGIIGIEQNCGPEETEFMLGGFRLIDQGARMLREGRGEEEARKNIREGNVLLLRHEQIRTLQPIFDAISPFGKIVVSFGSELDFPEPGAKPSFSTHAGYLETLLGWKSVTDSSCRWKWIEESVLPSWEKLDSSFAVSSPMKRELDALAALEPALVHHVAAFARKLFGMPDS
ncbi:MAG: hypothetical protein HGA62_07330 [Chlorobiaceae bacterium]|nr:hypothetical protein [Chlorobiaceae bacterium]NTV61015.1 hypothetical protein [Chlorobiaceae bacterium]